MGFYLNKKVTKEPSIVNFRHDSISNIEISKENTSVFLTEAHDENQQNITTSKKKNKKKSMKGKNERQREKISKLQEEMDKIKKENDQFKEENLKLKNSFKTEKQDKIDLNQVSKSFQEKLKKEVE